MSFEFKRFGKTIDVASNVEELKEKLERLAKIDPACVEYHLKEGHISAWLVSVGEPGLAEELMHAKTALEAAKLVRQYISDKKSLYGESRSGVTICRNVRLSV